MTGAETPRENSPFINSSDSDRHSYYDGKNMALFEVGCAIVINNGLLYCITFKLNCAFHIDSETDMLSCTVHQSGKHVCCLP